MVSTVPGEAEAEWAVSQHSAPGFPGTSPVPQGVEALSFPGASQVSGKPSLGIFQDCLPNDQVTGAILRCHLPPGTARWHAPNRCTQGLGGGRCEEEAWCLL